MEKMRMESVNMTEQNVEKIAALFPNCITEALDEEKSTSEKKIYKKVVNFDMLRQMLSGEILEGDEAYEFTWVGKKAAIVEANKPIRKTLRPCIEESVNWDTTENLYIEGDNLEVLKLLQESYLGRIKMIYIDPPYNTGHDFVYPDSFMMDNEEYNEGTGYFDDEGNVNYRRENSNSAGKYHSDWCSMVYSRLMVARKLLSDDGMIFISIDDNEIENMRKICDEIFDKSNMIATFIWQKRTSPDARKKISTAHEYILMYAKQIQIAEQSIHTVPLEKEDAEKYSNPDNDPKGPWVSTDFGAPGYRPNQMYKIITPGGAEYYPSDGRCWKNTEEGFKELVADGRIWFGSDGRGVPRKKLYLSEREGKNIWTWWDNKSVGSTQEATQQLTKLLGSKTIFDFSKPVRLIERMLQVASEKDSIILDFFSGSATTAHAVMHTNAADGGHRKFIMVQVPELTVEGSDSYKRGYKNICEIGKERIRRAAKKITDESPLTTQDLDVGFRVFKIDESNMNDVYYAAGDYTQGLLTMLESNVKTDRNDLDLLFGCLLEWGLPLSMPYKSEDIDGCKVHTYNDGDLIACFDENIPDSVVKEIAKRQPLRAVFRDSSFPNSPAKINVGEIFKMLAPDTRVKVI